MSPCGKIDVPAIVQRWSGVDPVDVANGQQAASLQVLFARFAADQAGVQTTIAAALADIRTLAGEIERLHAENGRLWEVVDLALKVAETAQRATKGEKRATK